MNWKTLTKTAKRTLSRNGSKILLGFGIAGAFTAVGFAISATPKAMILLEEKKQELGVEKLDLGESIKKLSEADYFIGIFDEAREFRGCIIENIAAKNYGIPFYLVNLGNAAPDVIERRKIDKRVDTLEIY